MQNDLVESINYLTVKFPTAPVSNFWIKTVNSQCVMFVRIKTKESPYVKHSVTINSNLSASVFFGAVTITTLPRNSAMPEVLSDLGTLVLLDEIEQVSSHAEHQSLPTKTAAHNFISLLLQDIIAG